MPKRFVTSSPALDALDNIQARLGTVIQMLANHDCHHDSENGTFGTDVKIAHEVLEAIRLELFNARNELRAKAKEK